MYMKIIAFALNILITESLVKNISKNINDRIDIPKLSEFEEHKLIKGILDALLLVLRGKI